MQLKLHFTTAVAMAALLAGNATSAAADAQSPLVEHRLHVSAAIAPCRRGARCEFKSPWRLISI